MNNSIPVIGTAIVNGVHWLARLIASVDYPVDDFVIFNNNGKGEITEDLDKLSKNFHPYIKKITVCHLPKNIGTSGAWNMIIKCYMNSPYWIIANHDVSFTPGFLKEMADHAAKESVGMVHGKAGELGLGNWDLFLIKDWVIQKYGLFDENFYPAYVEDFDYLMRIVLDPIERVTSMNAPYYHGDTLEYSQSGSQTWRVDMGLKDKIDNARWLNETEYMTEKWGQGWHWLQPYPSPFNKSLPVHYTTYDLNFLRRKNLGF